MLPKKNPNVEVGRNSTLYFTIGLALMMLLTRYAIDFKTYEKKTHTLSVLQLESELEEDIPIIEYHAPPPPPPAQAVTPEVITVVEDMEEVEETLIESTETSQQEEIREPVVSLEEVTVEEVDEPLEVPFAVIESVPVFPGCKGSNAELKKCFQEKMTQHIQKHFKYPQEAMDFGIHGKVFVTFVIDDKGNVNSIKTRGPDVILEKEAKRIIALLPKMSPGKQRDKPVKVGYSLPIHFKYEER
ncbi:MAG TPA: energy transducer TonB [Flavobacteriaceae bacterium]|nr:energy transducer TonB [Flavobacteriaceae bacterium]